MKDYKKTLTWVEVIAQISGVIDRNIDEEKRYLQSKKEEIASQEDPPTWEFEFIEETEEKIKALEWCMNQLNAPFKFHT